jgi:hypothetical protein
MKKLLSIMLLVMSVLALNAQDTKTPSSTETKKAPTDANAPSMSTSTLKVADLPKALTDNIAKEYPGYMIKEAMKAPEGSGADYKIVVAKGTSTETLLYDKNGKFVKKETKKTESHEMPKK